MIRILLLPLGMVAGIFLASFGAADDNAKPKQARPDLGKLLQGTPEDFIKRFDKDGDGYLTRDELPPRLAAVFDRVDSNGDGKLDKSEVAALMQVLRRQMAQAAKNFPKKNKTGEKAIDRLVDSILERMDANKDGKISRDEARNQVAKAFDRFDLNKDGYLDKSELRKLAEQFVANQQAKGGKNAPGPDAPPARRNFADFDSLDNNADGRLTREELKGTPYEKVFDQIDTNKDGKIDKKEFEAYLQKQEEKKPDDRKEK
jgi:Ca2+-binding EF-hand superfamily protein